jgi:hypothetical protein
VKVLSLQLILGCVGLLVSCTNKVVPPAKEAIATLSQKLNEVKIRKAQEEAWQTAELHIPFYSYDSVKTGTESAAQIVFSDQTEIALKENSLLVILEKTSTQNLEESSVTLSEGQIDGRLEKKADRDSQIILKTSRAWIRAKSTDHEKAVEFSAQLTDKTKIKVQAKTGTLAVLSKQKEESLAPGDSIVIANLQPVADANPSELPVAQEPDWNIVRKKLDPGYFEILTPPNAFKTNESVLKITGTAGADIEIIFRGKKIKVTDEHFSVSVNLKKGTNILTLQIVNKKLDTVKYQTLEIVQD